jgi:flavin reductase (DIM6/NTAB) family NADH-FMN oxidoreductase RutF
MSIHPDLHVLHDTVPSGPDDTRPPVDPSVFKLCMGELASGVAVIATIADGEPCGLLVSSLTALSAAPPRVLFCVSKSSKSHAALLRSRVCSINILARDHLDEARAFSGERPHGERFNSGRWVLGDRQVPRLADALSELDAVVGEVVDAGTHTIFLCDVKEGRCRPGEPLMYFQRSYGAWGGAIARP